MRLRGAVVLLISCLGFAGCTSNLGVEGLVPRPSNEVTSSISRPAAPVLSDGEPEADVDEAVAVLPADRPAAGISQQETPELPAQMVALAAPVKPAVASAAFKAGTISPRRFSDAK